MKAETVTFVTKTVVDIVDVDGTPIREGSILRDTQSGETGVVSRIMRDGERVMCVGPVCVGDLQIVMSPSCVRVSNRYKQFRHVKREEQTYTQRFLSWFHTKGSEVYASDRLSADVQEAITGILALMPDDGLDSPFADWPSSIPDALELLAAHLTSPPKKG